MFKPQTVAELVAVSKKATKPSKPRRQMSQDELIEAYTIVVGSGTLMENTSKAMKRGLSVGEAYAEARVKLTQSEKGRMALAHFESCAG